MQNIIDLAIESSIYSTQMLKVASFFSQLKDKKRSKKPNFKNSDTAPKPFELCGNINTSTSAVGLKIIVLSNF